MSARPENPTHVVVQLRLRRSPPRRHQGNGHDALETLQRAHGKGAACPRAGEADVQHVAAGGSGQLAADAVSKLGGGADEGAAGVDFSQGGFDGEHVVRVT